jgi:2-polyprenyl-3-methyl-5-hydroxy-6-metoxy-1,4-benzoquinol methylase
MHVNKFYKKEYEKLFRTLLAEKEPGHFDEAALPSYTHSNPLMSWLFWNRLNKALYLAGELKQKKVLDFGSGGGVLLKYLNQIGCQITACENTHMQLLKEVCSTMNIPALFHEDLFDIQSKQFDSIFALDVLEHVDDIEKYILCLTGLLKPDGQLIVSGPTENILYKMGRKLAGFSGHYHVRNIYHIEQVLAEKGMKKKKMKILYWCLPLFRISVWQKG